MFGHKFDSMLTIGRCVTNIALLGFSNFRKSDFQGRDDFNRIVYRQRSLRYISQPIRITNIEFLHILDRLNQMHTTFTLAHRPFDLGMPVMPDHDNFTSLFAHLANFNMYFRNQRTGSVEDFQSACLCFNLDCFGYAMRRKYQMLPGRHIIKLFNKNCTLLAQIVHNISVMDYFMAHIDGCAELRQCPLDNFNCTIHTSAKTARLRQQNFFIHLFLPQTFRRN